jgi:cell wall-associated NlpC family hydrolase
VTQALPMGSVRYSDNEAENVLAWRKKLAERQQALQQAQQGQQVTPLMQASQGQYVAQQQNTLATGTNALNSAKNVAEQEKQRAAAVRARQAAKQQQYATQLANHKAQYEMKKQAYAAHKQQLALQRQYGDYATQLANGGFGTVQGTIPGQSGGQQFSATGAIAGLSSAQQSNARAIANVALQRGLGREGVIAGLMTAITESTLNNVNHGDGPGPSSRGLFQQMPKFWGPESTIMNPAGAAGLFFDKWVNTSGTQWQRAQAVQRSQFSDGSNYRKNLQWATQIADQLLKPAPRAAGGGGAGALGLAPMPKSAPYAITTADGQIRTAITQNAQRVVGNLPYVWGGASLTSGADCSGLVQALYKQLGIDIPQSYGGGGGRAQAMVTGLTHGGNSRVSGVRTTVNRLQPGDLVAWNGGWAGSSYVGHIAVYAGNNQIIESPDVGMTVRRRSLRPNENLFGLHLTFK